MSTGKNIPRTILFIKIEFKINNVRFKQGYVFVEGVVQLDNHDRLTRKNKIHIEDF